MSRGLDEFFLDMAQIDHDWMIQMALSRQARIVRELRRHNIPVLTRKQWGTKHASLYYRRLVTRPTVKWKKDTLWQHITVTFDHGELKGDFMEDMQTIERIGVERFGSGVSYNFVIDPETGMIGMGMPVMAKGTHTVNHKLKEHPEFSYDQNKVSLAVAVLGMPGCKLSVRARRNLALLLSVLIDTGNLTPDPDYVPHRLVAAKSCPTDNIVAEMETVRNIGFNNSKKRRKLGLPVDLRRR